MKHIGVQGDETSPMSVLRRTSTYTLMCFCSKSKTEHCRNQDDKIPSTTTTISSPRSRTTAPTVTTATITTRARTTPKTYRRHEFNRLKGNNGSPVIGSAFVFAVAETATCPGRYLPSHERPKNYCCIDPLSGYAQQ